MLRKLGHVSPEGIVTLKGRAASCISTGDSCYFTSCSLCLMTSTPCTAPGCMPVVVRKGCMLLVNAVLCASCGFACSCACSDKGSGALHLELCTEGVRGSDRGFVAAHG